MRVWYTPRPVTLYAAVRSSLSQDDRFMSPPVTDEGCDAAILKSSINPPR